MDMKEAQRKVPLLMGRVAGKHLAPNSSGNWSSEKCSFQVVDVSLHGENREGISPSERW